MSNARLSERETQTFQITHPFHPLCGKTYSLVTCKHYWGQDRVCYRDEIGRLRSVPADWTSLSGEDPFVAVATGRSPFRVVDLLELARLVEDISSRLSGAGQGEGNEKV
jgi:hypothetical protein